MTTDQTLLPCPFCGGEQFKDGRGFIQCTPPDEVSRTTGGTICLHCNATLYGFKSREEAATAWNTRVTPPAPVIDGAQEAYDMLTVDMLVTVNTGSTTCNKRIKETIKAALIAAGAVEK